MSNNLKDYVTVADAAHRKGVTRAAINRAIKEGRLTAEWVGSLWLIHLDDLEGYTPVYDPPPRKRVEREGEAIIGEDKIGG